jgi:plastocyanin
MGSTGAGLSRRGFLRGVGGGIALAGATAGTANAQQTVTIDMTDDLVFDPDSISIAPGTTVVWENVGSIGHTVTAYQDQIPGDAPYFSSGGFDSEEAARNAYPDGEVAGGESFEHTFDVLGDYSYFCIPHESAGMVAELTVEEGGGGGGGGGGSPAGGGGPPPIPDSAKTLGIATIFAMLSTLGLTYFFMKYGGDYGSAEDEE